jgi:acyl-CoA thioesterase-2
MNEDNDGLQVTRLSNGIYSAQLSPRWDVWGPNGGYLCALLLRAVGQQTNRALPVSFSGQYLRSPSYDEVIITVELIKQGKTVSAYSVNMEQDGKVMLNATVWTADKKKGMEYQRQPLPSHYIPLAQSGRRPPVGPMPMWDNLEIQAVKNNEGHYSHWYRFLAEMNFSDPYMDAGRSLILIDTMQWPARYFKEQKPPAFVAPSLDLYVQFHRFNKDSAWLFSDATTDLAHRGMVAGSAKVWDEKGQLLASGGSQSLLMSL